MSESDVSTRSPYCPLFLGNMNVTDSGLQHPLQITLFPSLIGLQLDLQNLHGRPHSSQAVIFLLPLSRAVPPSLPHVWSVAYDRIFLLLGHLAASSPLGPTPLIFIMDQGSLCGDFFGVELEQLEGESSLVFWFNGYLATWNGSFPEHPRSLEGRIIGSVERADLNRAVLDETIACSCVPIMWLAVLLQHFLNGNLRVSVIEWALERKEGVVAVTNRWDQIFSEFEGDFLIGRDVGNGFYHAKYRNVI